MNLTLETILQRKSVRNYTQKPIPRKVKAQVLEAAMRSPTAGNLMLYSIIEITNPKIKDVLVKTCDNQPFIAQAPWVLLFLADYQRWFDYFEYCEVKDFALRVDLPERLPSEGDLMLACCDALIAAQTAVIAAESLGIGSCYIGDIMENYEVHQRLFDLPRYTFPICLLCLGHAADAQAKRAPTARFGREFIVFENSYRRLTGQEFERMFRLETERAFKDAADICGAVNVGQHTYRRKFAAGFTLELNRSVRAMLKNWADD